MRRVSLILALAPALATAPLRAQRALELGALIGYYRPVGAFDPSNVVATGLAVRPQDLSGAAWGAEARLWLQPRWGVQLQGFTAGSRTPDVFTPGGCCSGARARVTTITAQGIHAFLGRGSTARVWLGVGPAVIRHGGDAYSRWGSPTSPGASTSGGASAPLGNHLRVEVGAGATIYDFHVNSPQGGSLQSGVRKDLLLHVGLSWSSR